jgi:hypothetical protein
LGRKIEEGGETRVETTYSYSKYKSAFHLRGHSDLANISKRERYGLMKRYHSKVAGSKDN